MDLKLIESAIRAGLVRRIKHPDRDLFLYTHTPKCQSRRAWTETTAACRGLILDSDGAIIARPFPKFFEIEQIDCNILASLEAEVVIGVSEKVDGSLGIAYFPDAESEVEVATRGSFTSKQAQWATRFLRASGLRLNREYTYLFEIVYPENRIIVDYGVAERLVFLEAIRISDGSATRTPPSGGGGEAAITDTCRHFDKEFKSLAEVRASAAANFDPQVEGYVVTLRSGTRIKVKTAGYRQADREGRVTLQLHTFCFPPGDQLEEAMDAVPDSKLALARELVAKADGAFRAKACAIRDLVDGAARSMSDRDAASEFRRLLVKADCNIAMKMRKGLDCTTELWRQVKKEARSEAAVPRKQQLLLRSSTTTIYHV